jgi:hypothetical protein
MATKKGAKVPSDEEMRESGSPVKINYEAYNEEFGEGSSGTLCLNKN